MPYKDEQREKEASKERMRRYREKQKGVTEEGVTGQGVTKDGTFFKDGIEIVPAVYVQGLRGVYEFLPERPRYVTLSDGQVMDRAYKPDIRPLSGVQLHSIRACNETLNYHPNQGILSKELKARFTQ